MIIVSYYTDTYKAHADALAKSLKRLGYRCDFDHVGSRGSWKETTALKPTFLRRKLDEHKTEDAILWIDADAIVHRPMEVIDRLKGVEIAVYRHLSTTPYHSREWHNFGQCWNGTLYLHRSPFTVRVVEEWLLEQGKHPERLEQKNLASVLSRADPSMMICLPPEYCWVEEHMRKLSPNAKPVIEHFMVGEHGQRKLRGRSRKAHPPQWPEVLWSGHAYDHSGYAKANREVMLRLAQSFQIQLSQVGLSKEPLLVDEYTRARLDVHARTVVSETAPLVRFYTPKEEDHLDQRYRICWTMLETHPKVHPNFIYLLNENYHEVWTPSTWGVETFRDSGLKVPCSAVPLGFSPLVFQFRKDRRPDFPKARLQTTRRVGAQERPQGRIFLTVCQPTFRKGLDVLVKAWEEAGADNASLVIYTGIHEDLEAYGAATWRRVNQAKAKTRIYHLTGRRTELEMAKLYQAADVYITLSRGEGFDLPLLEAAACGLPVIAADHTSHLDLLLPKESTLLIPPDDYRPIPIATKISGWYEGQSFAWYGKKAIEGFAEAILGIPKIRIGLGQGATMLYNWDNVARIAGEKLLRRIS